MKSRYIPNTKMDRDNMLAVIGIDCEEDLFVDIQSSIRKDKLDIPRAMSEQEIVVHMSELAVKNNSLTDYSSFLGAGVYQHFIPSVVNHVISRSEFYTAYTPYQPEISQGGLQALFEFQTLIAELTGMDAANSSMYDGGTALAEAASMAVAASGFNKIVISTTVHPEAREILKTRAKGQGLDIIEVGHKDGKTDLSELEMVVDNKTAAVIVQYPNFFGIIEELDLIERIAHENKGLFVMSVNPISLPIIKSPGVYKADIVVGDCQPLGISPSLGGPHAGFFATTSKLVRKMPGRIVGQTTDGDANIGYVLTLQAREQHIRREKATSNICSNQALMALASAVYMSTMGKSGMHEVAMQNINKAHYAYHAITKIDGVEVVFTSPFFNEFVIKLPKSVLEVNNKLLEYNIIGGYDLSKDYPAMKNLMLIAVTEEKTMEQIDEFVAKLEGLL